MINKVLVILCCVILTACLTSIEIPRTNIAAVYMHEVDRYSVAIVTNVNGIETISFKSLPNFVPILIIADVSKEDLMWYQCFGSYSDWDGSMTENTHCQIHIRDIDSINTAGWDHGKFGNGQTIRIDKQ